MKLSICVITMNRAEQLREALDSCLKCDLPQQTEFVVIDNASTDNTADVVREVLNDIGFSYYYEKLPENLGVGGGRNYAYGKASGDFVYMLDDDAVIDYESTPYFFKYAIEILKKHENIATLTTQIYDTSWERNRLEIGKKKIADDIFKCHMFCGGSHFLRKSFFKREPYLPNKYGYEEIPPSLYVIDNGNVNAFCSSLLIIHKPLVDKWSLKDGKNYELLVKTIALQYAIKKIIYPRLFSPLLKLALWKRMRKYATNFSDFKKSVFKVVEDFNNEKYLLNKISFSTVIKMIFDFKLSAF